MDDIMDENINDFIDDFMEDVWSMYLIYVYLYLCLKNLCIYV